MTKAVGPKVAGPFPGVVPEKESARVSEPVCKGMCASDAENLHVKNLHIRHKTTGVENVCGTACRTLRDAFSKALDRSRCALHLIHVHGERFHPLIWKETCRGSDYEVDGHVLCRAKPLISSDPVAAR